MTSLGSAIVVGIMKDSVCMSYVGSVWLGTRENKMWRFEMKKKRSTCSHSTQKRIGRMQVVGVFEGSKETNSSNKNIHVSPHSIPRISDKLRSKVQEKPCFPVGRYFPFRDNGPRTSQSGECPSSSDSGFGSGHNQ